ncbi:MAG: 2-oxoacid:acceptor oxidoreductase subunit alpha [Propionibacteriaceae bacterium]|jgi:2-oxoglutarate ferredoxin oxidoreductase subunit alpha|nr:2-oxoacid:acceptor oxidoreductase subunit alpha [Propionibacteriaceae bacterium]
MVRPVDHVVIRFAGDSGDGMQLVGARFTAETARRGNDLATLPNYPAEIRAPAGTLSGVSSFQIHFADQPVRTPGESPDVLVALNPAALRANQADVGPGGLIIVDASEFTARNLAKAGYADNPLTDGSLQRHQVEALDLTRLAVEAAQPYGLGRKQATRIKNMVALGLLTWLYSRATEPTEDYLQDRFADRPDLLRANLAAFRAGIAYGESSEAFAVRYEVAPAPMAPGRYRQISGNRALALGLVTGAHLADMPLFCGSYPITPASDILHELSRCSDHGVITFQAEDEIAGVGAALGASFAGHLGVTTTSGPGLALKMETIGLAVMMELPLVVVDVQRAGPSTGMPTKTEQSDLKQALWGRPGESPVVVLAAQSPSDCFDTAVEACRIAVTYRTPVIVLTDGYLGNGAEPWRLPELNRLAPIPTAWAKQPNGVGADGSPRHLPYRRHPVTLIRDWAIPGTPGLEHRLGGLEKAVDGSISYDPANHDAMVRLRAAKVSGVVRDLPDLTVDDPSGRAELLVLGWGSTHGPIAAAVAQLRALGLDLARAHLRHLNPLPANLEQVMAAYRRVVVPEMNLGQLADLVRARSERPVISYSRVRGQPIAVRKLVGFLSDLLEGSEPEPAQPPPADHWGNQAQEAAPAVGAATGTGPPPAGARAQEES